MKKVNVKKEILVVLLIAVLSMVISTSVLATGQTGNPIVIEGLDTRANEANTARPIEIVNQTSNTTTNTTNTTNTTGSTYQNTSLPQTGDASDYALIAVIVIAVGVSIYAYRKVRNYNI